MTKILVSYDGTDADRDALELGRLLAGAGASLELAYVRHAHEAESGRERLAENEAEALLRGGASALGDPAPRPRRPRRVDAEGLRSLALDVQADVIVFGSEYRTARSHVDPQASARRLIDGGPLAVALAPAGFAEATFACGRDDRRDHRGRRLVRRARPPRRSPPASAQPSRGIRTAMPPTCSSSARSRDVAVGRVTISAAAEYVIELATCPVLVLPRGVAVSFDGAA